jgi:hypothetical protein
LPLSISEVSGFTVGCKPWPIPGGRDDHFGHGGVVSGNHALRALRQCASVDCRQRHQQPSSPGQATRPGQPQGRPLEEVARMYERRWHTAPLRCRLRSSHPSRCQSEAIGCLAIGYENSGDSPATPLMTFSARGTWS